MSDDTWNDIQAFKKRQNSLREKIQKRKKEREEIVQSLQVELPPVQQITLTHAPSVSSTSIVKLEPTASGSCDVGMGVGGTPPSIAGGSSGGAGVAQDPGSDGTGDANGRLVKREKQEEEEVDSSADVSLELLAERQLLRWLCDVTLELPIDSCALAASLGKVLQRDVAQAVVENWLQKFSAQELITIREGFSADGKSCIVISGAEHNKLTAVVSELEGGVGSSTEVSTGTFQSDSRVKQESARTAKMIPSKSAREVLKRNVDCIEGLLSMPSTREKESKKMGEEILDLLSKPTAKELCLAERFRSQGGAQVKEFCPHGTKEECVKLRETREPCRKLHFKKIIQKHTDESLGDCSFLNTCFHMDTCKYVHYEVDSSTVVPAAPEKAKVEDDKENSTAALHPETNAVSTLYPQQWIQCDLRYFDMSILGKFAVVMADPPWDIHMELPYGTMSDNEMRQLNIPTLQEEGLIFLWVTGRAMELGRECLKLWGYERCDEIIWVKTNQLQRIIRTGRTGHWLNHGKEHCLVGMKGNPATINRGLDCDVIVAEVRATSHKPDEIYGIIERLSPGTRKIELFGRPHNVQPNWITLGNQLDGVRVLDPELVVHFQERYPDGNCMAPPILLPKS